MIVNTVHLNNQHQKEIFHCGKSMLDTYFHKQVSQDVKRNLSVCFVDKDNDSELIRGYYTLSNDSIPKDALSFDLQKKIPYQIIPVILLGRLAVDTRFHGKGLGGMLLIDALRRSYEISKTIGVHSVVVDPLDETAESFYAKYNFIKLPDSGKMFLDIKSIGCIF